MEECMVYLTVQQIDAFLEQMKELGRRENTLQTYRRALYELYGALSGDKRIDGAVLQSWRDRLAGQIDSPRTCNVRISAVNSLLAYSGHEEWRVQPFPTADDAASPTLTRQEYRRLLQAAKLNGKERTYLLIKLIGCIGLPLQDLPHVTAEAVRGGLVPLTAGGYSRIPSLLQQELLRYAKSVGIPSGPLFITRKGTPMNHSHITCSIQRICRDAQVEEKKGTPLCLRRLYESTYADIRAHLDALVERAYGQLLEQEEQLVGWNM